MSNHQNLNATTAEPSLITFIKKNDDLPKGWMPIKSKRRSAGDIQELEQVLEAENGIRKTSVKPRRPSWTASTLSAGTQPQFLHWETIMLPDRVARSTRKNNTERFWVSIQKKWRVSAALCRRQGKDLRIKLKARYEALLGPSVLEKHKYGLGLIALGTNLIAALMDVVRDTVSIFLIMAYFAWYLLFWPVCTFLAALLCLQLLAMAYTVTSTAFLSNFCQQDLPIIRNWICSSWDEVQRNIHQSGSTNLNSPFGNILHSEEKTMSYELPHHLACYQARVRSFRASLPEFEYSLGDQAYFGSKFGDFINQTSQTILTTQKFHSHIVGTITTHLSDTKFVVQKLGDDGFVSQVQVSVSVSGLLARGMTHLNSWHLVYLPAGIEPFQTSSLQVQNIRSMKLMEDHVTLMKERLKVDVDLILTLQRKLWSLGELSEEIAIHVSQSKSWNTLEAYQKGNRLTGWAKEKLYGQDHKDYQINQRDKWLTIMGDEFKNATAFVSQAAHELTNAHLACQRLSERLSYEGRAVKFGLKVPDWVKEQAVEMNDGIEDLEAQLKAFKLEQLRFDDRVFRRGSTERQVSALELPGSSK